MWGSSDLCVVRWGSSDHCVVMWGSSDLCVMWVVVTYALLGGVVACVPLGCLT